MKASIRPMSEVPPAMVLDYLTQRGSSIEMVEWKYFDARFNRGRERGFVWVRGDRVEGLLGMIPCDLARGEQRWPMTWTCDWSLAAPDSTPGLGILLIRRAVQSTDLLITLGGNELNLKLMPRMAEQTLADAGRVFQIPLRLGAIMERIGRGAGVPGLERLPGLAGLPLRRMPRPVKAVRTEAGVAPAAAPLFEGAGVEGWHPAYDFEYLDWQVGRCPVLESATCFTPSAKPQAAALFWRLRASGFRWRMALAAVPGAQAPLTAVLCEAIRRIGERSGSLVSVLVSQLDEDLVAALRAQPRSIARTRCPLFLLATKAVSEPIDGLHRLSFLDTDGAQQF